MTDEEKLERNCTSRGERMKQPQEIYVIDTDVKVDMMNPERNIYLIPLERKFKCIQGGEGGKFIYRQVTRYFKESENDQRREAADCQYTD